MKMTIGEVIRKVRDIEQNIENLDDMSREYPMCERASELLCEYRDLIMNTKIDL